MKFQRNYSLWHLRFGCGDVKPAMDGLLLAMVWAIRQTQNTLQRSNSNDVVVNPNK
jgi:hypothetical protein